MLSCVRLFVTPRTAARPVPLSMGFSSKNTGVSCLALLQGVSPTQGSSPHLLHWQVGSLPLMPPGKPQLRKLLIILNFSRQYSQGKKSYKTQVLQDVNWCYLIKGFRCQLHLGNKVVQVSSLQGILQALEVHVKSEYSRFPELIRLDI